MLYVEKEGDRGQNRFEVAGDADHASLRVVVNLQWHSAGNISRRW